MKSDKITKIKARQILDSRGTPTVEVDVYTQSGAFGRASVPSGASTGSKEAIELRDGDKNFYFGKSVLKAVDNVNKKIAKKVVGQNVFAQAKIDQIMIDLDGTENKAKLGANAILGVSLAVAKAAANSKKVSLFKYLGTGTLLPTPMMNVINGGKHASSSLNIQEFMIVPVGAKSFSEALRWCAEVFQKLKSILKQDGYTTSVGDEGGFAPNFKSDEQAFSYIVKAVEEAGYKPKKDFCIAIDVAASEMFNEAKKVGKDGKYYFWKSKKFFTSEELLSFYEEMIQKYPIISIEDGFDEEDWDAWKIFTKKLSKKIQIVGDDLFVTNTKILEKGIKQKSANAILVKLNQIGTVTETINAVKMANDAKFNSVISHRSGETEDSYIADIAVALNAGQIKTGAPSRSDRVAKYNELLRIEEELGKKACFGFKIK